MNKFTATASVLALMVAGSVAAMADSSMSTSESTTTPSATERHGQPVDAGAAPANPAAPNQDLLALWANQGVISKAKADSIRAQLEQTGKMPGSVEYDQAAGAAAFANKQTPQ